MPRLGSHVLCLEEIFLATCLLPFPLIQWLSAPLWWIFNKGLFLSPSEELIKVIEARADEPYHPDLEALLSPPPHNYTCIIRTHMHTHSHSCMYTHTHTHTRIHIIETTQRTPNQSLSHIPTSLQASESPWSSNDSLIPRWDIIAKGWLHSFVQTLFIFRHYNHSSVLCSCIWVFLLCLCVWDSLSVLFFLSPLFSLSPFPPFSLPPSVSLCLAVSSLTLWPLCKTGDNLVFGYVVHANDLSVKTAYSNMTA